MHVKPNKIAVFGLAALAIVCSRMTFVFINDPEGPNLLIVTALAVVLFVVFLAVYAGVAMVSNKNKGQ